MRRGSFCAGGLEPVIVVEETGGIAEEDEEDASEGAETPPHRDSPLLNPYLLSPYRDMRKRSLPTPQCTSGITASQVRRLSEQGGEGKGPSPMEAAFLATLSQAPAPSAGGRRHSVVTISKVPKSSLLFGRNRRESFAAFPSAGAPPRFARRDSASSLVRTPSASGSSFNLQLDIMDDIAEIKAARKVKLKMWQNEGEEVCEVQPVDGGSTARYHQKENRRYSEAVEGCPPPIPPRRRASELPPASVPPEKTVTPPPSSAKKGGIVITNSDLIDIMSSLTSSAQEIGTEGKTETQIPRPSSIDQKRKLLKSNRSNSFDVSLLPEGKMVEPDQKSGPPGNWFTRRHLPMANKKYLSAKAEAESAEKPETVKTPLIVTLTDEKPTVSVATDKKSPPVPEVKSKEKGGKERKMVRDKPSGSVVDAQMLGSAIEVFLTQRGGADPTSTQPTADTAASKPVSSKGSWFGPNKKQEEEDVSCDNSICSTLKDLFVK